MKMKTLTLLFAMLASSVSGFAQGQQYVSVAVCNVNGVYINGVLDRRPPYVLKDTTNGIRYELNRKRNFIKAIDANGNILWETNPREDADVGAYRVKNPVIIQMGFRNNVGTDYQDAIVIRYNNSQFGFIIRETGQFVWQGQN